MKVVFAIVLSLCNLCASELAFEVVDESKTKFSREQQLLVLLEAYDVFSEAARTGVYEWRSDGDNHRVNLPDAKVVCDVEQNTLRIIISAEVDARELKFISVALQTAAHDKSFARYLETIKQVTAKMKAAQSELDSEKDPVRRKILSELRKASMPSPDEVLNNRVRLRAKNG